MCALARRVTERCRCRDTGFYTVQPIYARVAESSVELRMIREREADETVEMCDALKSRRLIRSRSRMKISLIEMSLYDGVDDD